MSDNTSPNRKKNSGKVDLLKLWHEYKSYWWLFLVSVVGCCGLAFIYSCIKLPAYSVQANVLVSSDEDNGSSMSRILSGSLFSNSSSVDDEQIMMSSHSVLMQTVKDLGLNKSAIIKRSFFDRASLYNDEPVNLSYAPELNDTLSVGLVFKINVDKKGAVKIEGLAKNKQFVKEEAKSLPVTLNTDFGSFTFSKTDYFVPEESFKETVSIKSYQLATESLADNINIFIPNKKANFITLELIDPNVERAKDILNAVIANYNTKGVADKQVKGYKTSDFLDQRLSLLAKELDTSEKDIELYKKNNNITDVRAEAEYWMQMKGSLESKLMEAETETEILKLTQEFLNNPANKYSLIPLQGIDTDNKQSAINSAITNYNNLILNRMRLENNAKPNNALLKVLSEQIDALRVNINSSLDKAIDNANVALNELRQQSSKSKSKLGEIPTQEREFYNIKRQQGVKEQLYLFLLQQREQAAISVANSMPRGTVIDEAYAYSKPVTMGRIPLLALGFMFGLFMPIVYITLKRKLRNKFATLDEVESYLDIPILGEVCTTRRKDSIVVKGTSSIAELFRLIRSRLQFILNGRDDKIILVTSTMSGEGKSFVSINLAASLALLNKKVLLVGMDIRKPQLAKYLDIKAEPGLTQYLSSVDYKLQDIIQHNVGVDGLDVIVAGPIAPNPSELLSTLKVDELFNAVRSEYDYIVIDSAPVGMVSDTFLLDRVADASVYVCRANYTALNDLDFIDSVYRESRLKKLALIVNGTDSKKGYGYGYGKIED